jgi:hypothetical protein
MRDEEWGIKELKNEKIKEYFSNTIEFVFILFIPNSTFIIPVNPCILKISVQTTSTGSDNKH